MGLRINIPLPGPFSYSMRATPRVRVKPIVRAMQSSSAPRRHTCDCPRPAARPQPRGNALTAGQAARLKDQAEARANGEPESAAGTWMVVAMIVLLLLVLFVNALV